jgi:hypothetical protein
MTLSLQYSLDQWNLETIKIILVISHTLLRYTCISLGTTLSVSSNTNVFADEIFLYFIDSRINRTHTLKFDLKCGIRITAWPAAWPSASSRCLILNSCYSTTEMLLLKYRLQAFHRSSQLRVFNAPLNHVWKCVSYVSYQQIYYQFVFPDIFALQMILPPYIINIFPTAPVFQAFLVSNTFSYHSTGFTIDHHSLPFVGFWRYSQTKPNKHDLRPFVWTTGITNYTGQQNLTFFLLHE